MLELTVHEAAQRRTSTQILDVREDFEVAEGMIPGALHIPLNQLHARLAELDITVPVITVCRSGNRSGKAAIELSTAGFTAYNMSGGILDWQQAGLPIEQ